MLIGTEAGQLVLSLLRGWVHPRLRHDLDGQADASGELRRDAGILIVPRPDRPHRQAAGRGMPVRQQLKQDVP